MVAETGSGEASVKLAEELTPDVIIMDISLPDMNGIDAARKIRDKGIKSKIILLSMYSYPEILDHLEDVKIEGYLLKKDTFDDLLYAIRAVCDGKRYTSSSLLSEEITHKAPPASANLLSAREKEIVSLIADGLSSREIAERLCISVKTVETHRARIMEKLGVRNVAELVRQAIKTGVIDV